VAIVVVSSSSYSVYLQTIVSIAQFPYCKSFTKGAGEELDVLVVVVVVVVVVVMVAAVVCSEYHRVDLFC
jgi:hypothetical protein